MSELLRQPERLSMFKQWRKHSGLMLMIAPVVAFFLLFAYIPMYGLVIAFKDFRISEGILGGQWNGLANFYALFSSDEFPRVIRNTVVISLLRLGFGFFAPVLLALLLNELRLRWYKRTVQTMTYLPHFFSWVVLGGIFKMLLGNQGPVNDVIVWMHTNFAGVHDETVRVGFLTENFNFVVSIVVTGIWQAVGYGSVIYLAALAGINPTLYEAATVDGASRLKQTWHITLPCLVPTMVTLLILSMGGMLSGGFDQIYNMYNDNVYAWGDIFGTFILRRMQQMDFAGGTAAGMFKSVVSLGLIVLVNQIARKISRGEQGVW